MGKKNKADSRGFVYSTDPDFNFSQEPAAGAETLPPGQQKLLLKLDTKQRAGKAVSLIEGFIGRQEDREELGRELRNFCGTGGSVKGGQIIIQGDQREKIRQFLKRKGYKGY